MPDVRYFKLAQKDGKYPKLTPQKKRIKDLQRFLDRTEFYIERCQKIEYSFECSIAESKRKNQEYRWFEYNNAVRSAIRIWEKYPDCSEPPTNNPDPLNGLEELKKWAIKELKNVGTKTRAEMHHRFKKADDSHKEAMEGATQAGKELQLDNDVYNWLKQNGCSQYDGNDLPDYDTWLRYLRSARAFRVEQQKAALKNISNTVQ